MSEDSNLINLRNKLDSNLVGYTHPVEKKPRKNKYASYNSTDKTPYTSSVNDTYKKITDMNTLCSKCSKIACQCNK
jgi:hypothetical protein